MLISTRKLLRDSIYRGITVVWGDTDSLVELRVMRGPGQGLKLKLDLIKSIESHYWFGTYDLDILKTIADIVKPGWVIWDCGIYLGYYSAIFARLVGARGQVVAFEPDLHNLQRSERNVQLNGFNNVKFVNAAISDISGEIEFITSGNTNSHIPGTYVGADYTSYQPREVKGRTVTIKSMSLDDAYYNPEIPNPNLIKIDIEGAEKVALNGLHQLVQKHQPLIVLELHNPDCDTAAWEFSQRENYRLVSLNTGLEISQRDEVNGTLLCQPKSRS